MDDHDVPPKNDESSTRSPEEAAWKVLMEGVDTVADPKVRVSPAAAKRRKSEGASTETENMNLKARSIEDAVTAAVGKIDDVPAMGEALATTLAPVNARLTSIEGRMTNIEARQANVVASDSEDLLQPLINAAGVPFPNFPGTYGDLLNMNDNEMSAFLAHYGLVPVDDDDKTLKRHQIKKFIGMRIG